MDSLNDRVKYTFEDLEKTGDIVTFACRMANLGYESAQAAPLERAGFRQSIAGRLPVKMVRVLGLQEPANCPYCGGDTAQNLESIPDLPDGSNEYADEVTCGECGGIYRIVWMAVRVEGVQAPEKESEP